MLWIVSSKNLILNSDVAELTRELCDIQSVSGNEREIADAIGPTLAARGLLLVGLDVIGDCLTEVNVTSPTCFQEIMQQTGFDVAARFVDALERQLATPAGHVRR